MHTVKRMALGFVLLVSVAPLGCREILDPDDPTAQRVILPGGTTGTLLGTLGGLESEAWGVNDAGVVVGWSTRADGSTRAFKWSVNSGMQELLPTWGNSVAYDAAGDFVVGMVDVPGDWAPFRVWPDGWVQILPYDAPSGFFGGVYAVNTSGTAVGWADDGTDGKAVLWGLLGTEQVLGTLPGDDHSEAWDINDNGLVVGISIAWDTGLTRAFIWSASGGMQALPIPAGSYSEAYGINNLGYVAGVIDDQAVVWRPDGSTISIGSGWPTDINDLGDVIGTTDGGAFVWDSVQGMQMLGAPNIRGWPAINSTGLAVASARNSGSQSAYYWQTVPGPPPVVTVDCDPNPVIRGSEIECTASVSSGPLTVQQWRFQPENGDSATILNVPGTNPWSGTMAIGGTVTVKVAFGTTFLEDSTVVSVQPRNWPTIVVDSGEVLEGQRGVAWLTPSTPTSTDTAFLGENINTQTKLFDQVWSGGYEVGPITSGPNAGWAYVSSNTHFHQRGYWVNNYLKSGAPADVIYNGQSYNRFNAVTAMGLGNPNIALNGIHSHEGTGTGGSRGHTQGFIIASASGHCGSIGERLEKLVARSTQEVQFLAETARTNAYKHVVYEASHVFVHGNYVNAPMVTRTKSSPIALAGTFRGDTAKPNEVVQPPPCN